MRKLIVFSLLLTTGCASLSNRQKRMITTVIGGSAGATFGHIQAERNSKADRNATIYLNAGIGMAGGYALGEWLYGDDSERYKKIEAERDAYKLAASKQGRYLIDHRNQDVVYGPTQTQCEDVGPLLCPGKDGKVSSCEEIDFIYVNRHWAVQYAAFYSPNGCFAPPYDRDEGLSELTKSLEQRLKNK